MAKSSAAMDKLRALHANNKAAGADAGGGGGLCYKSLLLGVAVSFALSHVLRHN